MSQSVVLNLGRGNCQQGFATVVAQFWQPDRATPVQFTGSLPPARDLIELYHQWQRLYESMYASLGWRCRQTPIGGDTLDFEFERSDITHISRAEFDRLSQMLQQRMNHWLNTDAFRNIERKLRTQLSLSEEFRFIITAEDSQVLRLPWFLWQFFEDYPQVEIALSPPDYAHSRKVPRPVTRRKVKILAILGDQQGIDLSEDQRFLEQLPDTELKLLVEPKPVVLNQHLWEAGWDILFFAGHSSSQEKGQIQLNPEDALTIGQLKYGLKKAIAHGLKLAIFNSCDGLELARDLADLHIPQVIIMREPVPDRVAQEFLKQFLMAFAGGQSLYLAVREAREKLQILESEFPGASWLPVICQNPSEVPTHWNDWRGVSSAPRQVFSRRQPYQRLLIRSLLVTGVIACVRGLGALQGLELAAYDQFIRWRPAEPADSRIVVVTIDRADVLAQGNEPRQGSLSDRTLSRLLDTLKRSRASLIGLDLYRDFPVSSAAPELAQELRQNDRLIAICKRPDSESNASSIAPPPEIRPTQVGFSDFVEDSDGVVRRHLLAMSTKTASSCTPTYAFSTELALRYLRDRGVKSQITPQGNLQLGQTIVPKLTRRTGGYQPVDARGTQLLLNYRANPSHSVTQVSVRQVLNRQIDPTAFEDKIVLIGTIFPDNGDYWPTPYGKNFARQVPGVLLQATLVSQLISASLDQRPLLWVWHPLVEWFWIWGWALAGAGLVWSVASPLHRILACSAAGLVLTGSCLFILIKGGWVPVVPPLLSLGLTASYVAYLLPLRLRDQP
ncbi:Chase2 sensor protein [Leptolyngbya sp. 'hensonii']|nr:Chase2 sensor protein [Leptolyngbya sp. 'hensonii']